jgi:hypothetical protein
MRPLMDAGCDDRSLRMLDGRLSQLTRCARRGTSGGQVRGLDRRAIHEGGSASGSTGGLLMFRAEGIPTTSWLKTL